MKNRNAASSAANTVLNSHNSPSSPDPNSVSRIAAGLIIRNGDIVADNDLRIDGDFEGRIVSKSRLILGESAHFKGDAIFNNVDVWGNFDGNAYVRDLLSLKNTCDFNGDIFIVEGGKFGVEPGAKLNGTVRILSQDEFEKRTGSYKEVEKPVETA